MRVVFFSFHFERDIWRAYIIRNSWYYKDSQEAAGFWDGSLYERSKQNGYYAIKNMIDEGLYGTSVTCVLIGKYTSYRKWVHYEINQSFLRGNGLLGIYIHNLKNQDSEPDSKGLNPFNIHYTHEGARFSETFNVYDWIYDNGNQYFADWVENAARAEQGVKIAICKIKLKL